VFKHPEECTAEADRLLEPLRDRNGRPTVT